jgi:hypothetical protein
MIGGHGWLSHFKVRSAAPIALPHWRRARPLGPVRLVNVGTVDCQRYQHCKNAEH